MYALLRDFGMYSAHTDSEIWVPVGFETDFASVPALGMALIGGQPGDRAAVVHDYLCRSGTLPRLVADEVFLEGLRLCNVEENVAQTMYRAVSMYTSLYHSQASLPLDWGQSP